jgi:signal transduction histidine kinase
MEERGGPGLREELYEAQRVAKGCLADVRGSVAALRPGVNGVESLKEGLCRLVSEFEAINKDCQVALDLDEMTSEPNAVQRMTLYRCAQETLTNISKHAQASKVLLRLSTDEQQAELTVLNNGQGHTVVTPAPSSGFGLLGMRERMQEMGGTMHAGAEAGGGWRVEVRLPLVSPAEKDSAKNQMASQENS